MRGKNQITALIGVFAINLVVCSCVSTQKEPEPLTDTRTHYTLRLGERTAHDKPLPAKTLVLVDWHMASGSTHTVPGYRGWDFNDDGRFEMLEVLAEDGSVQQRLFDFDGDGGIDMQK